MPRGHKGFTLIELLVVIAIIAILAGILFPVFARARAKAQQNACLSNIKQLALGVKMYMSDFDQKFPYYLPMTATGAITYGQFWKQQINPYVRNGQILVCPADAPYENNEANDTVGSEIVGTLAPTMTNLPYAYYSSYGYNWNAGSAGYYGGLPCPGYPDGEAQVEAASEMWILADATQLTNEPSYVQYGYTGPHSHWVFRHNSNANFAYVDGHAKNLAAGFPPEMLFNPCASFYGAAAVMTRFWSGVDPR